MSQNNLDQLPEFQEGANSKLEPHEWALYLAEGKTFIRCEKRSEQNFEIIGGCGKKIIVDFVEYFMNTPPGGYCKINSIALAKRRETFNPEYNE